MEVDGVGVHAIVGDPPDLNLAGIDNLRGRIDVVLQDEILDGSVDKRSFEAQFSAHPSVVIKGGTHLVMDGLRLHQEITNRCKG